VVIHLQTFLGDPMSKEIHFRHPKFAFLKLGIQFVFSQPLEHLLKMLHMFLHKIVIDQNVVYVYNHEVVKPLLENVIHEVQNVVGALVNPKGITRNSYEPYLVRQAVFSSSPFTIRIW
jgi:hypothetical protein